MTAPAFNDRLLAWSTAIGTAVLCLPLCVYAVAERVQAADTIAAARALTQDHEQRIRAIEKELPEIHVDVKWIRAELEKEE